MSCGLAARRDGGWGGGWVAVEGYFFVVSATRHAPRGRAGGARALCWRPGLVAYVRRGCGAMAVLCVCVCACVCVCEVNQKGATYSSIV